ncbi:MAG: hypothetical protein IT198_16185 [Acidimicrobiia bacterium]|nr:hypothetical protein [Acidimicrobiia bacterium]
MTDSKPSGSRHQGPNPALVAFGAIAVLALVVAAVLAVTPRRERGGAGTGGLIELAAPPPGVSAHLAHEESQSVPGGRTLVERRYEVSGATHVVLWFEDAQARLRQSDFSVSTVPEGCNGSEGTPCELRAWSGDHEVVLRTVDGETSPRTVVVSVVGAAKSLHTPPMDPIGVLEDIPR